MQIKRLSEHTSIVNSINPLQRGPALFVSGGDDGKIKVRTAAAAARPSGIRVDSWNQGSQRQVGAGEEPAGAACCDGVGSSPGSRPVGQLRQCVRVPRWEGDCFTQQERPRRDAAAAPIPPWVCCAVVVQLWDMRSKRSVQTLEAAAPVCAVAFSAGGDQVRRGTIRRGGGALVVGSSLAC